jgi:serine/threonine-protein kinase RsbW
MNTACSSNDKRVSQLRIAAIQRSLSLLEFEAWMPSKIGAISPTVEQLLRLIEPWKCIEGDEFAAELALREALNNAVIHGNGMDPNKLVEIRCRCERGKGLWLIVRDQGRGFDPSAVPNPLTQQGLGQEHGRGIHLMKAMMDEVSFKRGGSEVHMRKGPARQAPAELPTRSTSETRRPRKDKGNLDAFQSCRRE